ncbi:hypothetical protein ABPG74_022511 [Tetrahymena malaccensis]
MQDFNQNYSSQNTLQLNGRNCFLAINIINISLAASSLSQLKKIDPSIIPNVIFIVYHFLNILADHQKNLLLSKIQKIATICFGILHSIAIFIAAFFLVVLIFGKNENKTEDSKLPGVIIIICIVVLLVLILLIDIFNYKYLNQLIISLENKEYTASNFNNNQYQLNQQLINPSQSQYQNQVELKDYESQNQRNP